MTLLTIDGSHGEGGGAMLRTALALSTITGKAFRMTNIRSGRTQPGLKRQHLHCIRILQQLSGAKVEDAHLGSESIMFIPGKIKSKSIEYDTETAASTTLVCQCLILATIFSGKRVTLRLSGGTDVKWSPPADYLANLLAPTLSPLGDIDVKILARGYYPKGRGILEVGIKGHDRVEGSRLPRLDFTRRGKLLEVGGVSHASLELEQARVAERLAEAGRLSLQETRPFRFSYSRTASPGAVLTLWARYEHAILGADFLGERGVPAEKGAEEAARRLKGLMDSSAVVDPFLADQLVPYLGLSGGEVKTSEITGHVKSNIYVVEHFLDVQYEINEEKGIVKIVST